MQPADAGWQEGARQHRVATRGAATQGGKQGCSSLQQSLGASSPSKNLTSTRDHPPPTASAAASAAASAKPQPGAALTDPAWGLPRAGCSSAGPRSCRLVRGVTTGASSGAPAPSPLSQPCSMRPSCHSAASCRRSTRNSTCWPSTGAATKLPGSSRRPHSWRRSSSSSRPHSRERSAPAGAVQHATLAPRREWLACRPRLAAGIRHLPPALSQPAYLLPAAGPAPLLPAAR